MGNGENLMTKQIPLFVKQGTLLLITLFLCNSAFAQFRQHRDYVGGGFLRGDLNLVDDTFFLDENFDLNTLNLRLGVEMTRWFHLEGRVDFGLNDKAIGGVEVSINRLIGAHGVFSYPNDSLFRPYAVLGMTYGEVEFRVPGFGRGDEAETDFSFGAGVDAELNDSLDLFIEYMQYVDKGIVDFSGITLGIKFDL